ncbi:hypothetical protein [Pseudotabrizicola formosa]|uniref:hypothetical protein n=1 Tax=Pseudotabrizicola formosa TaxID=2030009 RepID=UPI000CD30A5F|nr:hypothetical protein [Pseudotabrizicola formosa]
MTAYDILDRIKREITNTHSIIQTVKNKKEFDDTVMSDLMGNQKAICVYRSYVGLNDLFEFVAKEYDGILKIEWETRDVIEYLSKPSKKRPLLIPKSVKKEVYELNKFHDVMAAGMGYEEGTDIDALYTSLIHIVFRISEEADEIDCVPR